MMTRNNERRKEQRLCYHWPIWFAEDFDETLCQGQMIDVSSGGAAFTCPVDQIYPSAGQYLTARFSVPRFGADDSYDMADFTRTGLVCRVDNPSRFLRRVAVQFAEPLPFRPGEQPGSVSSARQSLEATTA